MISTPPAASSCQNVTLPVIPELFDPNFLDVLLPHSQRPRDDHVAPPEATTSTSEPTFKRSPTFVAFKNIRPRTQPQDVWKILDKAWKEDPSLTLKLIWNSRSLVGNKRLLNSTFWHAYGWLYEKHPRTAILSLPQLFEPVGRLEKSTRYPAHGYFKDLLNILGLATMNQLTSRNYLLSFLHPRYYSEDNIRADYRRRPKRALVTQNDAPDASPEELKRLNILAAREKMVDKVSSLHVNLSERLSDPKFRALYIAVARIFADKLLQDIDILYRRLPNAKGAERDALLHQISLAAKWAPSPGRTHDRHTNISTAIATLIHHARPLEPPSSIAKIEQGFSPMEAHILRSYYQRWILTPLREALCIPEPLMSANRWGEIDYKRVSFLSMRINAVHFYAHDQARFQDYILSSPKTRTRFNSNSTMLPHDFLNDSIASYNAINQPVHEFERPPRLEYWRIIAMQQSRVVESGWKTMVNRLRESGTLDNAIAICDVSGSMGTFHDAGGRRKDGYVHPIFTSISLSILLGQLAKPPFNNCFITFSESPQLVQFDPSESLQKLARDIVECDSSLITNFDAVFLKLLLPLALKHKVKPEDMIKRIVVLSDRPFDESRGIYTDYAIHGPLAFTPERMAELTKKGIPEWEAQYGVIEKAYKEAGYQVPEILYWNLSHYAAGVSTAVDRKGVAYMNGLSAGRMRMFMGVGGSQVVEEEKPVEKKKVDPIENMKATVGGKSFDGLVVVD
ncbi:hypothetical protein NLI96_g730 [Meripilus lineatus]|uniref:Uncharacterized protein n=1 Tax=Meripilus lineatus TaxID=2056292 RepID=A0AAD5VBM2_9APHY|nr:hypothetical protein NLI96_g730 [Physisporinus lineatus]